MAIANFKTKDLVLNLIKDLFNGNINKFKEYVSDTESNYSDIIDDIETMYQETIASIPEEKSYIEYNVSEEIYKIENIHINLYRNSILILMYSFLENSMNTLCNTLYSRHHYPVALTDLKGEGIRRSKDYLEKLGNVNFQILNREWSKLQAFNKIRNCIVHAEGNIEDSRQTQTLLDIINNTHGLELKFDRYIMVEHQYIDETLEDISDFMNGIYQQI